MKNFYIISNALNTSHSVIETTLRQSQLLNTIASVRKLDSNATICVVEMSATPLENEQRTLLKEHVNYLFEYTWDSEVQRIHKTHTIHFVKNLTETLCLKSFFAHLKNTQLAADHKRIFKLSGRYQLTEHFNLAQYQAEHFMNKIVFAKHRPPAHYITKSTYGISQTQDRGQYMSRLWSFDTQLLDHICEIYDSIFDFMASSTDETVHIDIEHCLFEFMPKSKIIEVDQIGVQGLGGFTGMLFED